MKVYIASKYLDHKEINQQIYDLLIESNIDAFLPKSINVDAITDEELLYVGEICFDEIDKCDVILIVEPYGRSVSSEIGYAIAKKRNNQNKKLIQFNYKGENGEKKEAMITPYLDASVNSLSELIECLKTFCHVE